MNTLNINQYLYELTINYLNNLSTLNLKFREKQEAISTKYNNDNSEEMLTELNSIKFNEIFDYNNFQEVHIPYIKNTMNMDIHESMIVKLYDYTLNDFIIFIMGL